MKDTYAVALGTREETQTAYKNQINLSQIEAVSAEEALGKALSKITSRKQVKSWSVIKINQTITVKDGQPDISITTDLLDDKPEPKFKVDQDIWFILEGGPCTSKVLEVSMKAPFSYRTAGGSRKEADSYPTRALAQASLKTE